MDALPQVPEGAVWVTESHGVDTRAAALLMSAWHGGTVEVETVVAPLRRRPAGWTVEFWVGARGSDLLAGQEASVVTVDAFAYAINEKGGVCGFWGRVANLTLAATERRLTASGLRFRGLIQASCRPVAIRYLVRKPGSGAFGVGSAFVPAVSADAMPPRPACFFASPPDRWIDVAGDAARAEDLSWSAGRSHTEPTGRPVVEVGASVPLWLVVPSDWGEIGALAAILRSSAGNLLNAGDLTLETTAVLPTGGRVLAATWHVAAVQPGPYLIELEVAVAGGGVNRLPPRSVMIVPAGRDLGGRAWCEVPRTSPPTTPPEVSGSILGPAPGEAQVFAAPFGARDCRG